VSEYNHSSVGIRAGFFLPLLVAVMAFLTSAGIALVEPLPASAAKAKKLVWAGCGNKAEPRARCASLTVPQNYKRPRGKKFRLAMVKVPARKKKRGSLFFNPGGPGGSGLEFVFGGGAKGLPKSVKNRFDFVTWDPRGIGSTRPKVKGCEAFPEPSGSLPATREATAAQWRQLLSAFRIVNRDAALQCLPKNRGFTRHMGTRNVVRDLDRMRAAVGDRKLTFWGGSYGTRIGYTYALTYPKRLRAIVLDGSVNPVGGFREFGKVRAQATDRALEVIRRVRPAFGDRIIATRDDLRENGPVDLGGGSLVTQWDFEGFVSGSTIAQFQWSNLELVMDNIEEARQQPGPAGLQARKVLKEALEEMGDYPFIPDTGKVSAAASNLMALRIINHLDYADSTIPDTTGEKMVLDNVRDHPFASGPSSAFFATAGAGLGSLKPQPVPQTGNRKNARRAAALRKILITGSTGDGATPFVWSEQMAGAFKRAAFIRYDGWQHVNWTRLRSGCVNDPVTRFILNARKPNPKRPPLCPFALPGPPASPVG